MARSRGPLFPKKDWGRVFKECRGTLEGDIQALQRDPRELTMDLLENIGKHLQEVYKLLGESKAVMPPALMGFSVRYPLTLETREAYQLLKALTEFVRHSGDVSQLELNSIPSKRISEDSLALTKKLQSIDAYLSKIPQIA